MRGCPNGNSKIRTNLVCVCVRACVRACVRLTLSLHYDMPNAMICTQHVMVFKGICI